MPATKQAGSRRQVAWGCKIENSYRGRHQAPVDHEAYRSWPSPASCGWRQILRRRCTPCSGCGDACARISRARHNLYTGSGSDCARTVPLLRLVQHYLARSLTGHTRTPPFPQGQSRILLAVGAPALSQQKQGDAMQNVTERGACSRGLSLLTAAILAATFHAPMPANGRSAAFFTPNLAALVDANRRPA